MNNRLTKIFMLICTLIFLLCFSFGVLACGGNSPDNEPTNGGNDVVGNGSIGDENNNNENNNNENNNENNDDENNNNENNNEGNENQTEIIESFADCSGFHYDEEKGYFSGITFNYEDENVVFECLTDRGGFFVVRNGVWPLKVEVKNNEAFSWSVLNGADYPIFNNVYIDVILKVNNQIKGCELLEIYIDEDGNYKAKTVTTKIFTTSEQQEITEEKVKEILYENKDPEKLMVNCINFRYHMVVAYQSGIWFNYDDENAVFKCRTDKGVFAGETSEEGKVKEVRVNNELIWVPEYSFSDIESFYNDVAYIDVILIVDDQIKGYAVIKLTSDDNAWYTAYTLKAEILTEEELNGEQMTEEKVQELMDNCK